MRIKVDRRLLQSIIRQVIQQGSLYHVTPTQNVAGIKRLGIVPQEKPTFHGRFGQDIRKHRGVIYAFNDFDDAARFAFNLNWNANKDVSIIQFTSDQNWQKDQHWQAQIGQGDWLFSTVSVKPQDIIRIVPMDEVTRYLKKHKLGRSRF